MHVYQEIGEQRATGSSAWVLWDLTADIVIRARPGEPKLKYIEETPAGLRVYTQGHTKMLCYLGDRYVPEPITRQPIRLASYRVNGPGPWTRKEIERTGQRPVCSTGDWDLGLSTKLSTSFSGIFKCNHLFSITTWLPYRRQKIEFPN